MKTEHFTFHLQYKYSGTFANSKYEELSYPENPKMCDPILVILLKMWPHYSHSSRETATPSSSTSPLASYKEVPPPRIFGCPVVLFLVMIPAMLCHLSSESFNKL